MTTQKKQPVEVPSKVLRSLKRRLGTIADDLEAHGLILFSGHSSSDARIIHEETGIVVGDVRGHCWEGGDPDYRWHEGIEWTPDASRTAGDFIKQNSSGGF